MSTEIITREAYWEQLTEKEREGLAEGFHAHLTLQGMLPPQITVKEVYELCVKCRVHITFFIRDGREQFRLDINQNEALAHLLERFLEDSLDQIAKHQKASKTPPNVG